MAYDKIPSLWEDRHGSRNRKPRSHIPATRTQQRGGERERENITNWLSYKLPKPPTPDVRLPAMLYLLPPPPPQTAPPAGKPSA